MDLLGRLSVAERAVGGLTFSYQLIDVAVEGRYFLGHFVDFLLLQGFLLLQLLVFLADLQNGISDLFELLGLGIEIKFKLLYFLLKLILYATVLFLYLYLFVEPAVLGL